MSRRYTGRTEREVRLVATLIQEEDELNGADARRITFFDDMPYLVKIEGTRRVASQEQGQGLLEAQTLEKYVRKALSTAVGKVPNDTSYSHYPTRVEIRVAFPEGDARRKEVKNET